LNLVLDIHQQILRGALDSIMDALPTAEVDGPIAVEVVHDVDETRFRITDQEEIITRLPEIPRDEVGADVLLILISDAVGASWMNVPLRLAAQAIAKGGAA
jgi:hypothetical protein